MGETSKSRILPLLAITDLQIATEPPIVKRPGGRGGSILSRGLTKKERKVSVKARKRAYERAAAAFVESVALAEAQGATENEPLDLGDDGQELDPTQPHPETLLPAEPLTPSLHLGLCPALVLSTVPETWPEGLRGCIELDISLFPSRGRLTGHCAFCRALGESLVVRGPGWHCAACGLSGDRETWIALRSERGECFDTGLARSCEQAHEWLVMARAGDCSWLERLRVR